MGFDKILNSIITKLKDKKVQAGVPFIAFLVLGSYGLKEFNQIRYDMKNRRNQNVDLYMESIERKQGRFRTASGREGKIYRGTVSVEDVFKELKLDDKANDWQNKRVPRDD